MKIKSYLGLGMAIVIAVTSVGILDVFSGGAISSAAETAKITIVAKTPTEPEMAVKTAVFSAQYENYLPNDWFTTAKLTSKLTRKDAAYLGVYTIAKATGKSVEFIDYKTELSDTKDPVLRRAVDLGLISVGADMKFNPTKTVTQQEMAVITTKILFKTGTYEKPTKAMTFTDKGKIAEWAKESVQYLNQHGWLVWQSGKNFEPTKVMTLGRAISIMDKMMTEKAVYEKASATDLTKAKRYDVKGFKMPLPVATATELAYSVNANKNLEIIFTGNIKDRTKNTTKTVLNQITEILDSNEKITYDARSALLKTIRGSWDSGTQNYQFSQDYYILIGTGKITTAKPSDEDLKKGCLHLVSGDKIQLEIIL